MSGDGSLLLRRLAGLVADLLWPRECFVCGNSDPGDGGVCAACWRKLLPAPAVESPSKRIDRLVVAFAYDETLRAIIHHFKFEQAPGLAVPLAEQLERRLQAMGFTFYDSVLVPVPSHPARRRERGYNPAEKLARALGHRLDLPCHPEWAKRLEHGPHQSQLPDEARKRTLHKAFEVQPPSEDASPLLRLVLVDDVIHTGRTLAQLARAAKASGWGKVDGVILSA